MRFDDFRQQRGGQDCGMHQAAGKTLRDYYKDCEKQNRFPKTLSDEENARYRWIFEKIDRAIHTNGTFRGSIVTTERIAKESSFFNLAIDWIEKKPENRTIKPPSAMQETEPLMVYYYFTYLFKDHTGLVNNAFAKSFDSYLKEAGEVSTLRKARLAKLKKAKENNTDNTPREERTTQTKINSNSDNNPITSRQNPKTALWLAEPSDETRFLYRSRSIPFIGSKEPIEQLDTFKDCSAPFLWHVVYGPGGTGKSRLALEYALKLQKQKEWHAGFLDMADAETFDWNNWQPQQPYFLIIDYAAREAKTVAKIISCLSMRNDLTKYVRLLLLERDVTGAWFNQVTWRGRQESHLVSQTWFDEDGMLEPPDDVWPIIKHMCRKAPERLPNRQQALKELERIDNQSRPLFAAFLGDAYFRKQNARHWDSYSLVENVLEHEKSYWKAGGVSHQHINLCATATATGGIPGKWLDEYSKTIMKGFWPEWQGNQTLETLSAIYGDTLVDDIPPLEPDILGEAFFLQHWKAASRYERDNILNYGSMLAPWFAGFLERLISDFPASDTFNLLKTVLAVDFGEYTNSKSELLYNLVTSIAKSHPSIALQIYKLFPTFEPSSYDDYQDECILDACHNLIVGIEELNEEDAFEIYNLQREQVVQLPLIFDRSRAGIGMSLIARFPMGDSVKFRSIIADVLKVYRRHSNDHPIKQDTCIAISNYVNLLGIDEIKHAKDMFRLFRKIAQDMHEDDMEGAWSAILYHLFLLLMLEENSAAEINDINNQKTFQKLLALATEAERYENRIFKMLKKDMK